MTDAEVFRLRRLRNIALSARAIAAALHSRRTATIAASESACWRIARVITGTLRRHPYPSYQEGPSQWRGAYDRAAANVLAVMARYRGRSLQTLSAELRRVARELDDARALTLSTELSDTLGRSQAQLRRLIQELDAGARAEEGNHDAASRLGARPGERTDDPGSAAANWPYLAF